MSNSLNLPEIEQEEAFNLTKFFLQSQQNILNTVQGLLNGDPQNQTYIGIVNNAQATLDSLRTGYKTWNELLDYIIQDPDFELLCKQFIKDEDLDGNGVIKDKYK